MSSAEGIVPPLAGVAAAASDRARDDAAAPPAVPQIRAAAGRAGRRRAAGHERVRFLVFLPGNQGRADPPAAGEGARGGRAHRGVCRRDRAADRLDDACAMGRLAARPAPPGLFPAAASGAGDHRGAAARCRGAGAAQGVAAGDGRDRQRRRIFRKARPFSGPRPIACGSARSISASNPSPMSRWRSPIRAATPGSRSPKSI